MQIDTQCDCRNGPQDLEHYLLECNQFTDERKEMTTRIMEAVLRNKDCRINNLSVCLLIGDVEKVPRDVKIAIRGGLLKFLSDTAKDINI